MEMEETLKEVLMRRDGLSADEAEELIAEMKAAVAEGDDPEGVLADYAGLEMDYIWELFP
jgi:hypothetical protein